MSQMRIADVSIKDANVFEILLDHFPDMIHSIDDSGRIVYTNKTAEKLLGYTRDELLAMNIREVYAPEIFAAMEKGFTDLKAKGDKRVPESLLKAKDGTRIPVEIRSFSIYDDRGQFLRTFSILRDIREIKALQQSLIHAGRLAAIGELASGVAHDINNPLTVILLANEMMLRDCERNAHDPVQVLERVQQHTLNAQRASRSIQKLADHLRNFSRGMVETHERLDIAGVINDAIFITQNRVMKCGVTLCNHVPLQTAFVMGSPNQLEQVLVNLISNACDAMDGRPERTLTLALTEQRHNDEDCWGIDIRDTGGGVPAEILEEIFLSFFTTKPKGQGTGLGLSISRGILRDHKGDLTLHSIPGQGSSFTAILPKAQA